MAVAQCLAGLALLLVELWACLRLSSPPHARRLRLVHQGIIAFLGLVCAFGAVCAHYEIGEYTVVGVPFPSLGWDRAGHCYVGHFSLIALAGNCLVGFGFPPLMVMLCGRFGRKVRSGAHMSR